MEEYRIGELARLAGVPAGTLRFYERLGLIPSPPRSAAGYRRYGAEALARLKMVRRAKELGFTLSEIGELLEMLDRRATACHHVHCRLTTKLAEIDAQIGVLHRIKSELEALSRACATNPPIAMCPTLASLMPEEEIAALATRGDGKPT